MYSSRPCYIPRPSWHQRTKTDPRAEAPVVRAGFAGASGFDPKHIGLGPLANDSSVQTRLFIDNAQIYLMHIKYIFIPLFCGIDNTIK